MSNNLAQIAYADDLNEGPGSQEKSSKRDGPAKAVEEGTQTIDGGNSGNSKRQGPAKAVEEGTQTIDGGNNDNPPQGPPTSSGTQPPSGGPRGPVDNTGGKDLAALPNDPTLKKPVAGFPPLAGVVDPSGGNLAGANTTNVNTTDIAGGGGGREILVLGVFPKEGSLLDCILNLKKQGLSPQQAAEQCGKSESIPTSIGGDPVGDVLKAGGADGNTVVCPALPNPRFNNLVASSNAAPATGMPTHGNLPALYKDREFVMEQLNDAYEDRDILLFFINPKLSTFDKVMDFIGTVTGSPEQGSTQGIPIAMAQEDLDNTNKEIARLEQILAEIDRKIMDEAAKSPGESLNPEENPQASKPGDFPTADPNGPSVARPDPNGQQISCTDVLDEIEACNKNPQNPDPLCSFINNWCFGNPSIGHTSPDQACIKAEGVPKVVLDICDDPRAKCTQDRETPDRSMILSAHKFTVGRPGSNPCDNPRATCDDTQGAGTTISVVKLWTSPSKEKECAILKKIYPNVPCLPSNNTVNIGNPVNPPGPAPGPKLEGSLSETNNARSIGSNIPQTILR